MRTFFCYELSDESRERMQKVSEQIDEVAYIKWVSPENLHITVKFLGEIEQGQIPEIRDAAQGAIEGSKRFKIDIDKFGCFPDPSFPKVLWLGSSNPPRRIFKINEGLEENLAQHGFEREKRDYIPHVTLGRTKENDNKKIKKLGKQLCQFRFSENLTESIKKLTLMESELRRSGPIYNPVFRLALGE